MSRGAKRGLIVLAVVVVVILVVVLVVHSHSSSSGSSVSSGAPRGAGQVEIAPVDKDAPQPMPAAGTCHYGKGEGGQPLPDPGCTPGVANQDITQKNIDSTICDRTPVSQGGWTTKSVRAPDAYTSKEKRESASAYGFSGDYSTAELDHLVPLSLGGSNSGRNLWIEPNSPGAKGTTNAKDKIEIAVVAAVCSHKVPLAEAQSAIAGNWTTALSTLGISDSSSSGGSSE